MDRKSTAPKKLITKRDLIIILIPALLAACFYFLHRKEPGTRVLLYSDNELIRELSLSHDTAYTVSNELGSNTVVIEDHQVYVRDADCPDRRCEKQGPISKPGDMIICLPHKLIIEVSDGE